MKKLSLLFLALMAFLIPPQVVRGEEITDELTPSMMAFNSKDFTIDGAKTKSGASYAGSVSNAVTTVFQFNKSATGIYVSANPKEYTLKSISLTYNTSSGGTGTLSLYGADAVYTELPSSGTSLGTTTKTQDYSYTFANNEIAFALVSSKNVNYWSKITVVWIKTDGSVSSPEIVGPEDVFFDSAEVSLSCATEGAEIYYTLDGEDPTLGDDDTRANCVKYTGVFTIDKTTTVKAISVLDGEASSVVSKTFTAGVTVATAAELYASSPVDGAVYRISGPMTVVKQKSDNGNIFLLDADGVRGMRFFNSSKWANVSYSEGQTLSNVVGSFGYAGNTSPQLVVSDDQVTAYWPATAEGEEATVEPTVIAVDEVSATDKLNSYVKVEKTTITKSGDNYYIGANNAVQLYDTFGTGLISTLSESDLLKAWDVTGFVIIYNKQVEIAITALTESVTVNEEDPTPATPVISMNGTVCDGATAELKVWPGDRISFYSAGATSMKVIVDSDEESTEIVEGNIYTYVCPDEMDHILEVSGVYTKDEVEYPSESVLVELVEIAPKDIVITIGGKTVPNESAFETKVGETLVLTVSGATSLKIGEEVVEGFADGTYSFDLEELGEYVFTASNAAGSISRSISLEKQSPKIYKLVKSLDEFVDGTEYIVAALSSGNKLDLMGSYSTKKYYTVVSSSDTYSAIPDSYEPETTSGVTTIVINKVTSAEGNSYYTLYDTGNSQYIQVASYSDSKTVDLSLTDNADVKDNSGNYLAHFSLSIGDSGAATIKNGNVLRYNSNNPRFKTYSSDQNDIYLYRLAENEIADLSLEVSAETLDAPVALEESEGFREAYPAYITEANKVTLKYVIAGSKEKSTARYSVSILTDDDSIEIDDAVVGENSVEVPYSSCYIVSLNSVTLSSGEEKIGLGYDLDAVAFGNFNAGVDTYSILGTDLILEWKLTGIEEGYTSYITYGDVEYTDKDETVSSGNCYVEIADLLAEDEEYNEAEHNWSAMAANVSKLPLHYAEIGPNMTIAGKISVVYPFLKSDGSIAKVSKSADVSYFITQADYETGVKSITLDGNESVEYYNLAGYRVNVENLQGGVYIVRMANGETKKVMVK